MQDTIVDTSHTLLLWLLMLLMLTVVLFGWRCYRAGVMAMFGRYPPSARALMRLAVAASLPALLCSGWLSVNPELSAWAWFGTAHLAITWCGLQWLLPDGLNQPPDASADEQ